MRRVSIFFLLLFWINLAEAQINEKPLILPFQDPPSANTWLLGQVYGNTTGAYNFGDEWYSAGQGLHFGLDFSAACGTPLVATADGIVAHVDNLGFGSAPHNLILWHEAIGVTTLYGHLLETPELSVGEVVMQGQFVGYSGDPDLTCDSRPHLHLEVRSLDYRTAYNPVDYIDANWNSLALIGSFGERFFQMDLYNARRWMSLDEQPSVAFGGQRLNAYTSTWPTDVTPANNPPLPRTTAPIVENMPVTLRMLEPTGCCWEYWWHPTEAYRLYTIDGFAGQAAQVYVWDAPSGTLLAAVGYAPPLFYSPDYSHSLMLLQDGVQIQDITGAAWIVQTGGTIPAISPDNNRMIWTVRGGDNVPGQDEPTNTVFISDIRGDGARMLLAEDGLNASWLDSNKLLLTISQRPYTRVEIYDVTNDSRYTLGTWYRPRGFKLAPGGGRLMFYLASQPNPAENGIYWVDTSTIFGAEAHHLNWFGAYRWRDANSVFYIPFNPNSDIHELWIYDLESSTSRQLSSAEQSFTVMNGQWSVNADGTSILFRHSIDRNLWFIDIATDNS
jgi:hypothetical protein